MAEKEKQETWGPVRSDVPRKTFSDYIDYVMNVGRPGYPDNYKIGSNRPPVSRISENKKDSTHISEPSKPALSLEFDGEMLTFRVDEGDRIKRYSYSAVAGRPLSDGSFDYSRERQRTVNEGPLPEGEYWVDPN